MLSYPRIVLRNLEVPPAWTCRRGLEAPPPPKPTNNVPSVEAILFLRVEAPREEDPFSGVTGVQ
eukprot:5758498-Amphidinium_carterae.1